MQVNCSCERRAAWGKIDLHPSVDRKQMPEAGRRAENTHGLANKGTSRLGVRASISGDLVPFWWVSSLPSHLMEAGDSHQVINWQNVYFISCDTPICWNFKKKRNSSAQNCLSHSPFGVASTHPQTWNPLSQHKPGIKTLRVSSSFIYPHSQVVWIEGHSSSYILLHDKLSQSLVAKTAIIILLSLVIIQEGFHWLILAPSHSCSYSHITVIWWLVLEQLVASQAPLSSVVSRLLCVVSPLELLCTSS